MISVVIPAYKNFELLRRNLSHNLPFLHDCEVIVVNDYPQKSLSSLHDEFPHVKFIENQKNIGFGATVNHGVKQAQGEYVMLLNTDVLLNDDSYTKAVKTMQHDHNIFAVSFAQKEKNGSIEGKKRLYWYKGFLNHSHGRDLNYGKTGWAEGGSCLISREKFLHMGGFDPLYKPFYWEDTDISYRAWKTGYDVYFDPEILVEHHHESTIGKYFSSNHVRYISFRNQLIFIWKNITDTDLLSDHIKYLFTTAFGSLFKGHWYMIVAMIAALTKIGIIKKFRREQRKHYKRSDQDILDLFK